MGQITEAKLLPHDVDAEPIVQAAAALQPIIRGYRNEIDRDQRLPKALVEEFHAAGFYRLVRPRELGGLQVDPLTYLRVVELLAEASGSIGWNLCNNNIAQLVSLGLPEEGIREIFGQGGNVAIAGTAVQGGGRAVPVDGGYRVSGRWPFGTGCQESGWMLGSFQILDGDRPRPSPD
ncbi:MAG: acyl-CoA dehydrogenase family protein, partial [Candidatus Rokuibacteriota bacterium]